MCSIEQCLPVQSDDRAIKDEGLEALTVLALPSIERCAPVQSDDRAIKDEGLDALTDEELRHACRARGMRTPYGEQATDFMRRQLQEWLDLSLNR